MIRCSLLGYDIGLRRLLEEFEWLGEGSSMDAWKQHCIVGFAHPAAAAAGAGAAAGLLCLQSK